MPPTIATAAPADRTPELPPCDLVLKGGVTSAVIYARLLNGLSGRYRLKRLGGTSAGAVGAAVGAVAQLARDRGVPDAFARVDRLPIELGERHLGKTRLMNLFQPAPATRRTFGIVLATLDQHPGGSWVARLVRAALRAYMLPALLGGAVGACIAGIAIAAMCAAQQVSPGQLVTAVLGVAVGAVLALLFAAIALVLDAARGLSATDFGLCRGMPGDGGTGRDALTVWLHDFLNGLLGRGTGHAPVTFGELWGGDAGVPTRERRIDLQVITTALNLKQPFRVPGDAGDDALREFFYDPLQWRAFFPPEVMDWLKAHARARPPAGAPLPAPERRVLGEAGAELSRLPAPADLPIIVAVRLSLSFPALLSALPMYVVDRTRAVNRDAQASTPLKASKLYFSDGGITSNFPIHLFDAALPAHPTFGVDLSTLPADKLQHGALLAGLSAVDRPGRVGGMESLPCPPFETASPWQALFSFAAAIVESARTWRDTMQQSVPGYRDRIVRIGQTPAQGGVNLGMTKALIAQLGVLGLDAANLLIDDFAPRPDGAETAWDVHRWLRMRSTLCMTGQFLDEIGARLDEGTPSYRVLPYAPTEFYKFGAGGAVTAAAFMNSIGDLMARTPTTPELSHHIPKPPPALRITPLW